MRNKTRLQQLTLKNTYYIHLKLWLTWPLTCLALIHFVSPAKWILAKYVPAKRGPRKTQKKSHYFLTCSILIVKRIARWGEVFLLHDSSHRLHRNTSIWAYDCMKMMFTNVSIFTMSVNCYTIVTNVTTLGIHVCHCVVVVFFFSLTNTGFAFDDHFLAVYRAVTSVSIGRILWRTSTIGDFCTSAILWFGKLKFREEWNY